MFKQNILTAYLYSYDRGEACQHWTIRQLDGNTTALLIHNMLLDKGTISLSLFPHLETEDKKIPTSQDNCET